MKVCNEWCIVWNGQVLDDGFGTQAEASEYIEESGTYSIDDDVSVDNRDRYDGDGIGDTFFPPRKGSLVDPERRRREGLSECYDLPTPKRVDEVCGI